MRCSPAPFFLAWGPGPTWIPSQEGSSWEGMASGESLAPLPSARCLILLLLGPVLVVSSSLPLSYLPPLLAHQAAVPFPVPSLL